MIGRALSTELLGSGENLRLHAKDTAELTAIFPNASKNTQLEVACLNFASADSADYSRLTAGCSTVIHTAGLVHNIKAPLEQFELLNMQATQ